MKIMKYFFVGCWHLSLLLMGGAVVFRPAFGLIALLGKYISPSSVCNEVVFYYPSCFFSGAYLILMAMCYFLFALMFFLFVVSFGMYCSDKSEEQTEK